MIRTRYQFTAKEDATYCSRCRAARPTSRPDRGTCTAAHRTEKPDFRLIVMPPSTNGPDAVLLQKGTAQAYSVLVARQDGFNGDDRARRRGIAARRHLSAASNRPRASSKRPWW